MAHRIQHLVCELRHSPCDHPGADVQQPGSQAVHRLSGQGRPARASPAIRAHLSLASASRSSTRWSKQVAACLLHTQFWLADKAELIWLTVKRAITSLEKAKRIPPEAVDPEEALQAISLWKGSLIPPDRAGSYHFTLSAPGLSGVRELARMEANALTFDDFVPLAIHLLEDSPSGTAALLSRPAASHRRRISGHQLRPATPHRAAGR